MEPLVEIFFKSKCFSKSTAPAQGDGAAHWMLKGQARLFRPDVCSLQLEIPLAQTICIVDQHQRWVEPETLSLQLHRALVLPNEFSCEDIKDRFHQRHPRKDVPGGAKIQAAAVLIDRSHDRAIHHPVIANPNLFDANVGQRELDRRSYCVAVEAQKLISPTVRTGRVGTDAKAVRNGLECLL